MSGSQYSDLVRANGSVDSCWGRQCDFVKGHALWERSGEMSKNVSCAGSIEYRREDVRAQRHGAGGCTTDGNQGYHQVSFTAKEVPQAKHLSPPITGQPLG